MKKLLAFAIVAILLVSTLSVVAFANHVSKNASVDAMFALDNKGKGDHPFIRRILNRIADRLDLTDEQRAQIRQILEKERPVVQPLLEDAKATRQQILAATANGTFNEEQITALANHQAQNMAKLIVERERVKTQIYQVLTPEQRKKVEEMKERFEQRIRERVMQEF